MTRPAATAIAGIRQQLIKAAPFSQMRAQNLDHLIAISSLTYYQPGEVVLEPEMGVPDHCWIITQGTVVGERPDPNGVPVATWELTEREMFPIGALLAERPVTSTYRARGDVFCLLLPRDAFTAMLERSVLFKDFCTRRISSLLDLSRRQLQAAYVAEAASQQSMETALAEVELREPVTCGPKEPLRAVLGEMRERRVGSMLVIDDARRPLGIFTRYDLVDLIAQPDHSLDVPIESVMTRPVLSLHDNDTIGDAALMMGSHGIRHLAVLDDHDRLVGVVSERDLFGLLRLSLRQVGASIRRAETRKQLIQAAADIRALSRGLVAQGVAAAQLTRFISSLNDQLTARILRVLLKEHDIDDIQWCWLALGSEGRQEQTISTDQDNALIFELPDSGGLEETRKRMMALGAAANEWLRDCGFPLCTGRIMAGQADCCLTPGEWREAFAGWVNDATPESILKFHTHSDFRPLAGRRDLAQALRRQVTELAHADQIFLRLLAQDALRHTPPLNWLGRISEDGDGTIDLKLHGTLPFTDAARVLALVAGVDATSTSDRLHETRPVLNLDPKSVKAWQDAFHFLQLLRLRHQHLLRDRPEAESLDQHRANGIDPDTLSIVDRRILKESFRQIRKLQQRLRIELSIVGN